MGRLIPALLAIVLATPAMAETPMSGEEFDAYVTGKSLLFRTMQNPTYGVERYLPDQRVVWSPRPGLCVEGEWYQRDDQICFTYDNDPGPECWLIYDTGAGLRADLQTGTGALTVFEVDQLTQPICPGIDLLS